MDTKKTSGRGKGSNTRHQKSGCKNKSRKPEPSEGGKRYIDGKNMHYYYRSGKWKLVDNTPIQIDAAKKERAEKVEAAALLVDAAEGEPMAGMTAALHLPTVAPNQDKLKSANVSNLVFEQLSIAMKAELDNP
jgi:hypothetical protein